MREPPRGLKGLGGFFTRNESGCRYQSWVRLNRTTVLTCSTNAQGTQPFKGNVIVVEGSDYK